MSDAVRVGLDVPSTLAMLELVATMAEQLGSQAGLDEDSLHWIVIATREAVMNAVKHGNAEDERKRVHIEFTIRNAEGPPALVVRVRDEGSGFDPNAIADPCDPQNLSKPSGRGLLIMRRVLDELVVRTAPEGGTEVSMTMRAKTANEPSVPTP